MKHPGGRDPTLGRVQHQNHVTVTLTIETVLWAREHTPDTIKVIAGREVVIRNQRDPLNPWSDPDMTCQRDRHAGRHDGPLSITVPASAEATQSSMLASAGR